MVLDYQSYYDMEFKKLKYFIILAIALVALIYSVTSGFQQPALVAAKESIENGQIAIAPIHSVHNENLLSAQAELTKQCIDALENADSTDFLLTKKKMQTKVFLKSLPSSLQQPAFLSQLALAIGLDQQDGLSHLAVFDSQYAALPKYLALPEGSQSLSLDKISLILRQLQSKQYGKVAEAVERQEIAANSNILRQSLLSTILSFDKQIAPQDLDRLLSAGISVFFTDFNRAIESGHSSQILTVMNKHAQLDLKQSWDFGGKKHNLATVAVESRNADALMWLIRHDVTIANEREAGILASIPAPESKLQKEQSLLILGNLIDEGFGHITSFEAKRLMTWLDESDGILQKLKIQTETMFTVPQQNALDALTELVEEVDAQLNVAHLLEKRCLKQHQISRSNNKQLTEDLATRIKGSDLVPFSSMEQKRSNLLLKLVDIDEEEEDQGLKGTDEMIAASIAKQWDKAIELAQELQATVGESDNEYLQIMLFQAIQGDAPWSVISGLLNKGAKLEDEIVIFLVISNNVNLAKRLIERGLHIHFVDDKGRNALTYTVMSEYTKEMFYFLLNQGIEVKPSATGLDSLDLALQSIGKFDEAVNYVVSLLKNLAPVEKSHLQQLSLLAISNPVEFALIISKQPQLMNLL